MRGWLARRLRSGLLRSLACSEFSAKARGWFEAARAAEGQDSPRKRQVVQCLVPHSVAAAGALAAITLGAHSTPCSPRPPPPPPVQMYKRKIPKQQSAAAHAAVASQAALAAFEEPNPFVRPGYQAADQVGWAAVGGGAPPVVAAPELLGCMGASRRASGMVSWLPGSCRLHMLDAASPKRTACCAPPPPAAAAHGAAAHRGGRVPRAHGAAGRAVLARRRQVVPHPVQRHLHGLAQGRVSSPAAAAGSRGMPASLGPHVWRAASQPGRMPAPVSCCCLARAGLHLTSCLPCPPPPPRVPRRPAACSTPPASLSSWTWTRSSATDIAPCWRSGAGHRGAAPPRAPRLHAGGGRHGAAAPRVPGPPARPPAQFNCCTDWGRRPPDCPCPPSPPPPPLPRSLTWTCTRVHLHAAENPASLLVALCPFSSAPLHEPIMPCCNAALPAVKQV